MKIRPVMFRWVEVDICREGGEVRRLNVMVPHQRFAPLSARQYVLGEDYPLTPVENRSMASHNHYFAAVSEAFDNLPEAWAKQFPTSEHMRKWVLIEAGFFDLEEHDLDTAKDAKAFAAMVRRRDEYVRIKIVGSTILLRTAKSQDTRSMKKEEFQASKTAVLDYVSEIIGINRAALEAQAAEKVPPRRLAHEAQRQIAHQPQQGDDDAS